MAYPGFQRGGCLRSGPIREGEGGGGVLLVSGPIRKAGGGGGGGCYRFLARYEKWGYDRVSGGPGYIVYSSCVRVSIGNASVQLLL